jgi:hypothetical protein
MGARLKLNRLHLTGDFFLAVVVGLIMHSWVAMLLVLAALVAFDWHTGAVRSGKDGSPHPRRRRCDRFQEGGKE